MVAADAGTDSIVRPANRRTTLRYVRFAYTSTSARTTSAGRDYWAGWLAVRGLPAKVERPTRDRAAERDADEIVSSIAQSLDLGEDNTGWFSSLCSGTLKHCSDNGSQGKKKRATAARRVLQRARTLARFSSSALTKNPGEATVERESPVSLSSPAILAARTKSRVSTLLLQSPRPKTL